MRLKPIEELLKFKMRYGLPYVLVRWTGLDAAGDTWEPLDNLTNCEAAIAAFEQATGRSLPRPLPPPLPLACAAGRLHGRGGAARRPGRRTCGQDGALLVARRRLAARTHATELSVDRPGLLAK